MTSPAVLASLQSLWKPVGVLALGVSLFVAGRCQGAHAAGVSADASLEAAYKDSLATARHAAAQATTVYVHDTVVNDRWRLRLVHDTLPPLRDTVLVKVYIARHDSAYQACTATVASCGALVKADEDVIRQQAVVIQLADKQKPSIFQRHMGPITLGAGVTGFVLGFVAAAHKLR